MAHLGQYRAATQYQFWYGDISRSAAYMRLERALARLRASFLDDSGVFQLEQRD